MFQIHRHRITGLLAGVAVGLSTVCAEGGDFQPKRVAADAKWLAFVNVEGCLDSSIGEFMVEHGHALGFDMAGADFDELHDQFGLDLMKDLKSITVYGEGMPEDGAACVALFETSGAIDQAVARLAEASEDPSSGVPPLQLIDLSGQKVNSLGEGDETAYFQIRPGSDAERRLVIFSLDREWMNKGLGVLEGKAASLASAEKTLVRASAPDGVLAFVSCNDLDWVKAAIEENHGNDHEPASAIIRGAKGIDVSFGELKGETFFAFNLTTASKEDAQNLSDIGRGLVAMARLAGSKEPEVKPLLEPMRSLQINVEGDTISMSIKHDSATLIEALGAMAKLAHEMHDDHDDDDDDAKTKVEIKATIGGDSDKADHHQPHDQKPDSH